MVIKYRREKNVSGAGCVQALKQIAKGEWIDLETAGDIIMQPGEYAQISLGIAMKLPKGYEAVILPRSSTYKHYQVIQANSAGIIDSSYSGTNDLWSFPCIYIGTSGKDMVIKSHARICQFRIQLSQKATAWQKLKWLFTSGLKFKEVDILDGTDRGGFGTTGK